MNGQKTDVLCLPLYTASVINTIVVVLAVAVMLSMGEGKASIHGIRRLCCHGNVSIVMERHMLQSTILLPQRYIHFRLLDESI